MSNAPSSDGPPASRGFSIEVPPCVAKDCWELPSGVIVPNWATAKCLGQLKVMETRPDDIFLVTYPKSGTTWLSQLTLLIQFEGDCSRFEGTHVRTLVPYPEASVNFSVSETAPTEVERADTMTGQRIIKIHGLPEWLPEAARPYDPEVKIIYLVRNPKDTAVSCYFFYHFCPGLPKYETWNAFFEDFITGRVPWGSWFEHVFAWCKKRNHPNFLIIKYEDLIKDLPGQVRKIAGFMGKSLSDDVISKIAGLSTFKAMRASRFSNPDLLAHHALPDPNASFFRKGQISDWKNYFTVAQSERFDLLYRQQMAGYGLELDFE